MKGAADALCNPEAGVPGQISGQAAGGAGLGGDPSHDLPKGLGPPSPAVLQDERTKGGPSLGHHGCSVLEGALARFYLVETSATVGVTEESRDIPGFSEAGHASGDPDVSGAAAVGGEGSGGR